MTSATSLGGITSSGGINRLGSIPPSTSESGANLTFGAHRASNRSDPRRNRRAGAGWRHEAANVALGNRPLFCAGDAIRNRGMLLKEDYEGALTGRPNPLTVDRQRPLFKT